MNAFLKKIEINVILKIVFSIFTYLSFLNLFNLPKFDIISWLLFVLILFFYFNIRTYIKKYFKLSIWLSILFSTLIIFGKVALKNSYINNISVVREFLSINNIISLIGLGCLIYVVLINIFSIFEKKEIYYSNKIKPNPKKLFIIVFIILIICWLPYFLSLYPAEISYDSVDELGSIANGLNIVSNHHPVIHALFLWLPYTIGYNLFNSANIGVSLCAITQMIVMSIIFSYFVIFLYKRNVKNIYLILIVIFYAIIPMHGFYSVTLWKDVVFSGLVLLLSLNIYSMYENRDNLNMRKLVPFILISVLTLFFRSNSLYMYIILVPFLIILFKKEVKLIILSILIVFVIYFMVNYPVFNMFKISKASSSEYIAMPLQQIGRMAYKDVEFTKKEKQMINELIDIDVLKASYNPVSVDSIKFNKAYNKDVFDKNKKEYLFLWAKLVIKHPTIAVESYAISTLGYWYPNVENWVIVNGVVENDLGIYKDPKGINLISDNISKMSSKNILFFNVTWSTGICFYLILISCSYGIKKCGLKMITFFIPVIGIWLTMMVAAPVNSEFRYIYSLWTTLPFTLLLPKLLKNKIK